MKKLALTSFLTMLFALTGCTVTFTSSVSSGIPIIGGSTSEEKPFAPDVVENITLNHESYSIVKTIKFNSKVTKPYLISDRNDLISSIVDEEEIISEISEFQNIYKNVKNIMIGGEKKSDLGKLTLKLKTSYKAIEIIGTPRYHTYVEDWNTGVEKIMMDTSYLSNFDKYVKLENNYDFEQDVKPTTVAFKYDSEQNEINLSSYYGQINLDSIVIYK